MLTLKMIEVMGHMLNFLKAGFIIAVCFLVSMSVVFATEDSNVLKENEAVKVEEKWRLPIGSKNVRYETKYTIILNGEKHEYYLKYKDVIPINKNINEAKFKGYYWGMKNKNQDLERDENYIYSKDKVIFTREDVIEFLEIIDAKLVANIKDGCEFSLYVEPVYKYQKGKWSDTYKNTLRELYVMLPEAKGEALAYENARNESGEIEKEKIQGVEFLRKAGAVVAQGGAVELVDHLAAGGLVEAVDVLGDHGRELPGLFQLGQL